MERIRWSEDEINFLVRNKSKYTTQEFAKKLKRSPSSIASKLNKLGLPAFAYATDLLTKTKASGLLNISRSKLDGYIKKGMITTKKKGKMDMIDIDILEKFLINYPNEIDINSCSKELDLCFKTYKWYIDRKKEPFHKKREYHLYTKEELSKISVYYYNNQNAEYISKKLNIPKKNVEQKISRLRKEGVIKCKNSRKYNLFTEEEESRIIEYYQKGYGIKEIAQKLDRGFKSIDSKVSRLKTKGRIKKL